MLQRFAIDALPAMPWKNGGGNTREIACWPPGASLDAFDWRVSIATIAASGPFSVFPGVDRTIMLLEGDGVQLEGEGVQARLDTPHAPFAFSGDIAIDCTLRGRTSTDFNLMSRRDRGRGELQVVDGVPATVARCDHGLVMSLAGDGFANGTRLAQGQGVWWADEAHAWQLAPATRGARLLAVRWLPSAHS